MNEEVSQLQSLGAQKIYEDTHIPVLHIQALLHGAYDSFSKVQFLGFISILEKEYSIELNAIREDGLEYFSGDKKIQVDDGLFVVPKKSKNRTVLYLFLLVLIFISTIFYTTYAPENNTVEHVIDNSMIQYAQEIKEELNTTTSDENNTKEEQTVSTTEVEEIVVVEDLITREVNTTSFRVVAKTKVWLGYIDLASNKKKQVTIEEDINLDPNKNWLMVFGHNHVDFYIEGQNQRVKSRSIHYLYKDGNLADINASEFQRLNRGVAW